MSSLRRDTTTPRFEVTPNRPAGFVDKRGPSDALAHEARGLRRVSSLGLAPPLIGSGVGELRTGYVHGTSRDLTLLTGDEAAHLAATLHRLHSSTHRRSGYRPGWRSRSRTLSAYVHRRAHEIRDAAPPHRRSLADAVVSAVPEHVSGAPAFSMLHGDLVSSNIIWTPAPVLIDWEFWRSGDPAEDLAYLVSVNDISESAATAICQSYDDCTVVSRIPLWRDLCRLEAALWYERHGDDARATRLFAALERSD